MNKLILSILFISILFTYSSMSFSSNMSIGTGHAYLAKSLVSSGNFNLNESWGNAGVDIFKFEKNYYLPYAPLNAVIMAIPYFCLQVFLYFYTHIFGGLNGDLAIVLESIALSLPSSLSLFGILYILEKYAKKNLKLGGVQLSVLLTSIGLGTILFTYSISFFNHIISAFLTFAAFYLLTNKKYTFAGILIGLAFLNEFPIILFALAVLAAELIQRRSLKNLIKFAIPIAIAILAILAFNQYHYHNPFLFAEELFKQSRIANNGSTYSFSQNPIYGLYGSLFSPLKGIFFFSPFLLFGIFGIKSFLKNKYDSTLALTYTAIIILLYSFWNDCFGATVYGDRYLVNVIPYLGLLLAYSLATIFKNALLRGVFLVCCAASIIVSMSNTLFGIADGASGRCAENLNIKNPYTRMFDNLKSNKIKMSPVIMKVIRKESLVN